MKKLIIVESPAKCKKIESFLGEGYTCISTYGHFRQLIHIKDIHMDKQFQITYHTDQKKNANIAKLRTHIHNANSVILATDDDREGEAIAWHVCDFFNLDLQTTPRIVFHEITKNAILKAINSPSRINMNIVYAQKSRQILDMILGFKMSPVLWSSISRNHSSGLSAGRCQTPALRLVYENQKEVESQKISYSFTSIGYFTSKNIPFELNHSYTIKDDVEEYLSESVNHDHIYSIADEVKISRGPPEPFTTSSLQQKSSNQFHMSPKETMSICQKLYENGYITYMGTDSKSYSKDFVESATAHIASLYGDEYVSSQPEKLSSRGSNENAQEAHEAIRPTKIQTEDLPASCSPKEKRLYKLIWMNTIESCMNDAKGTQLKTKITSINDTYYTYNEDNFTFLGWKIVQNEKSKDKTHYLFLKQLKMNSLIQYKKITSKCTPKNMKQHFTEAKLVQLLENKGIGRPSTYSSLIEKIQTRKYVCKQNVDGIKVSCDEFELVDNEIAHNVTTRDFGAEKNKLILQPLGRMVIECLIEHFDNLFAYTFTNDMEKKLDLISQECENWIETCDEYHKHICEQLKMYAKNKPKRQTHDIDENHTYMIGKYGPVIKHTYKDDNGEEKIGWKKVKPNITISDIITNSYSLDDIILNENDNIIGEYKDKQICLKNGKFGDYITWNGVSVSLLKMNTTKKTITLSCVIQYLEDNQDAASSKTSGILRRINNEIHIRAGKYGPYIFYQTKKMKKPNFIKLAHLKETYMDASIEDIIKYVDGCKK